MGKIIFVALGGAVGATCRYLIGLIPVKGEFPFLTLLINLCGAVLIGFIVGITLNSGSKNISESQVLFLKVGFCGGFTTFSTFSLEALQLIESGKTLYAGIYVVLSVVLCIFGVAFGKYVSSVIFAK